MKKHVIYLLLLCVSVFTYAEDVFVTTPDGSVTIHKGDLVTTAQTTAFYGLYDSINQCRLYIKLADGILSQGLNEVQTSVDVIQTGDIIFPDISLPPSTANKHTLVMQCLGPVQDGKRQVTFSTDLVDFDIFPNVTTNIDLGLYLTQLTVKAVFDSNYLTPGETISVETVANEVMQVTLDANEAAFTATYNVGDQPKSISDLNGDKIGIVAYDSTFGNVFTENLDLNVNDGRLNISAAFVIGDVILSSPGLLVNNLPDSSQSKLYNFDVRGLEVGNYQVVLTVDGAENEVEYPVSVTIGSGSTIPATTGRVETHVINSLGEVMSLSIDFTTMYDDILNGVLINPEVRLFLVKGGPV